MQDQTLDIIDRQEWLDPLADQVQGAVQKTLELAGPAVQDALHGTWLGHPLHPALTDVPVGAWTAAVVMDAMEDLSGRPAFGDGADAAIAIGLTGAVAAAAAGLTDWQATDGAARKTGLTHGLLNIGGALLFAGSLAMRKRNDRPAAKALSTLGFLVVMGSAWLGGKLVYSERIGVDHSEQRLPDGFTAVMNDADLPEGEMRRVEVEGARILLARCNGQVRAMGEVCSHLGGPLADGKLENCQVTCPWHGSTFSLQNGSVVHGPATHPQPFLETRVREGQIEVKRA